MARRNIGTRERKVKKVNKYSEKELRSVKFQMEQDKQTTSLRYLHVKRRIDSIDSVLVSN